MVYINPMRERIEIYNVYIYDNSRQGIIYLPLTSTVVLSFDCCFEVTIRQRQASSKRYLCKVAPTRYPSSGFCKYNASAKLHIFIGISVIIKDFLGFDKN